MAINKIKKFDLCLGCGLCEAILGSDVCKMLVNTKGFYEPQLFQTLDRKQSSTIKYLCPSIHIETGKNTGPWGSLQFTCEAWANDNDIRHKAASGGVVTSLAIYLLESKQVDAVLQVGVRDDSYLFNELKVSRTRAEVLHNAQSRYAPALVFSNIHKILDETNDSFAFIGKPCDVAGLKNFLSLRPKYRNKIKVFISIFCAGMPSYNATIKIWKKSGHQDEPLKLRYRGEGWPGNFCAEFKDGSDYQVSYNESWGKILGRSLGFRCKICPDGIGMLADIAVGDSWKTKTGYPDFSEADGRSFCMIRTNVGNKLMKQAQKAGYIHVEDLDINMIKEQQSYQYNRRKLIGWRLIPVQLATGGFLNFRGLGIWAQALTANPISGFRNMIGTLRRLYGR